MARLGTAIAALALLCTGGPAVADVADRGRFDLRSAEVRLVDGVYRLDAIGRLELSPRARDALEGGVTLTITLDVEILRQRRWWLDEEVASIARRMSIELHELSRQYIVTNRHTGERRSFYDIQAALAFIGRSLDFPIIDAVLIRDPSQYYGRARMRLQRDALPWALRPFALVYPDWRLQTNWLQWSFE